MRLHRHFVQKGDFAYLMIECLVYIGLVFALLGVGYAAMYRCIKESVALRQSADDIIKCLHAGERWRADVRLAKGPLSLQPSGSEQLLIIPTQQGELTYRFGADGVYRKAAGHPWSRILSEIKSATVESEPRQDLTVWRWELELQTRTKSQRVRPLFTFIAVPGENRTQ